ncbi:MAG: aspartate--tRNA ligase [Clostridia bacterium]|nr:aspartate--tRNA ligase [Clostridia bacterium]MBR3324924.1 aspartate--tRNA ligase [Clostridia bacterium]
MNKYRTYNCSEIREENIGEEIKLAGWVDTIRDLGGILFMDLRDQYGVTQVVFSGDEEKVNTAQRIPIESTITVSGIVRLREDETVNKKIPTGMVELFVDSFEILGKRTKLLPFDIENNKRVKEDLRLEYRFLDLRARKSIENLKLRAELIQFLRNQMIGQGFLEVQTPILTSSSPEGARDYLVPSRVYPGKFYALPQAPQQFKQLLMVSGVDKYFQIAPCFRDEDARADRSPGEFYQLDMEMAFATQEDVFEVMEKVIYNTFKKFSSKKVDEVFERISYEDAMIKYGTDKPDLRNPLEIKDVTNIFKKLDIKVFNKKIVRTITLPDGAKQTRTFYDTITNFAIDKCHAKGLAWLKVLSDGTLQGPIAKLIDDESRDKLLKQTGTKPGDSIFFIAERKGILEKIAGPVREKLGILADLLEKDCFRFCWIVDFPMFEADENGKIKFSHNPFSMPQGGLKALSEKNPLDILAYQYDIVCNGVELSSGAVRNHDPEIMVKAFEIAGYSEEELKRKFSALFNAFHYGAPPHAGVAPGLDRMLMLLAEEESIREVIAFPMNSKAEDLLVGAPSVVSEKQLKEANIKIIENNN